MTVWIMSHKVQSVVEFGWAQAGKIEMAKAFLAANKNKKNDKTNEEASFLNWLIKL